MAKNGNSMVKGFLHAEGRKIVNGEGEEVILRGFGVGNWTNPEGFMVGGAPDSIRLQRDYYAPRWMDRGRSMDAAIRELCGTDYAEKFWPRWYRNHLGEADIKAMADLGYNSVRLVLSARAFLYEEPGIRFNEDSFAMLDDVIDWCEKYKIYAILDMHGAPGGQSAAAIDDGIDNMPHLFLDEETWDRALRLWEEFAIRYGGRWIVGGYDLLNEPLCLPEWQYLIPQLAQFYDEAIAVIRKHDKRHMFTLEGTRMATCNDVFFKDYDPECHNWAIHVHYYGFSAERKSLATYLERSLTWNVPIWLGEGAGGGPWSAVFYEMCADLGIGYAMWCWKTAGGMGNCTYDLPEGWDEFRAFFAGGPKPGYERSQKIFDQMLENIKFENCRLDTAKQNYNLRRPPLMLPAVGYDALPGQGVSFTGDWPYGNVWDYRIEDRTHLMQKPGRKLRSGGLAAMNMYASMGPGRGAAPAELPKVKPAKPGVPMPEVAAPQPGGDMMSRMPNAVGDLMLGLRPGDFAVYTIHDVPAGCTLALEVIAQEAATLTVEADGVVIGTVRVSPCAEEGNFLPVGTVPAGELVKIKVIAGEGRVCLLNLDFKV